MIDSDIQCAKNGPQLPPKLPLSVTGLTDLLWDDTGPALAVRFGLRVDAGQTGSFKTSAHIPLRQGVRMLDEEGFATRWALVPRNSLTRAANPSSGFVLKEKHETRVDLGCGVLLLHGFLLIFFSFFMRVQVFFSGFKVLKLLYAYIPKSEADDT